MYEKKRYRTDGVGLRIKTTQDIRILKRPSYSILYLFTIMLLFIVKDSYGHGKCHRACFGLVWKVRIWNELSNGYVHVEGNTVVSNDKGDGTVYKISKGANFYLYDANAAKFICWSYRRQSNRTTLVARKYKTQSLLRMCEFRDTVSTDEFFRNSHVHLLSSFNDNLKMKFKRNGKFSTRKCDRVKLRHQHKKCVSAAAFLVFPVSNDVSNDSCGCQGARNYFCHSELRNMTEIRGMCDVSWPRSNETYET